MKKKLFSIVLFSCFSLFSFSQENEKTFLEKAKSDLIHDLNNGKNEFWILFNEQADVSGARQLKTKEEKGEYVYKKLTSTADRIQPAFYSLLENKHAEYQTFWIVNAIYVKGDIQLAKEISAYPEVKELLPNVKFVEEKIIDPIEERIAQQDATSVNTVEWGITKVNAPSVWALGYKGQGVVVSGHDTGYDWTHPALKNAYRGWNGSVADHNFNWHDAIHSGGGTCGADSKQPCDDSQHGTHTMGTMVGDDGAGNQIGMAPSARWIGCRNMNVGVGTTASYIECFQWLLAPTDSNNQNANPSKAPHVINNSWGCDPSETGCTNPADITNMETAVKNLVAAGVVVVVSAGNSGSGCNTITTPSAIYDASFTVGATTSSDAIASYSSRGNVSINNTTLIKPNVSAPGSSIRSSVPGGGYASMSGTSMAGPHVVGAVALLISAVPSLAGQVDTIESILERTAVRITSTQTCNGTDPTMFPNNTVGYGRIDILAAVNDAISHHPLSVSEQNKYDNGITVFPTPADDKLYFRFENFRNIQADVTFFNTTGQIVLEQKTNTQNNSLEIPVTTLPEGFYLYSIKANDTTYHGKFIKK